MADTGFHLAGAGANGTVRNAAWANPGRITADDGSNSTVALDANDTSHNLEGTNFGIGPGGSYTVDGIEVEIEAFRDSGSPVSYIASLILGDTAIGSTKGGPLGDTSGNPLSLGGPSDTWGATLSQGDVESSSFGVAFIAVEQGSVPTNVYADYMSLKVYYTATASGTPGFVKIARQFPFI